MQRCFQLARLGKQKVKPNPMVGAVLVHEGRIIGEGYHEQFGRAHAEVNCINNVGRADAHLIAHSTMYVSLEPCIHFGKTPPCADLILQSGIKKVIIGCRDPFSLVNGGGIKKLEDAGVEVLSNYLEKEAVDLNRRFFTFHTFQRPYIILKWAQSSDGKIASTGKRYHISNPITNTLVHRWRSEEGAIMIGANTALIDNPSLTTRLWPGDNPLRLVIDGDLRTPVDSVILTDDQPVVIFNRRENTERGNKIFHQVEPGDMLPHVMRFLFERNISSLIVEGGTALLQSFIDSALWDEARFITNRSLQLPEGLSAPLLKNAQLKSQFEMLNDHIQIFTKGEPGS